MTVVLTVDHNFVCPVADDADANTVSPSNWNDTHALTGVDQINTELGLKADKATTISAGAGLTGGGDLSANRTIALHATDITVPAIITVPNVGLHLLDTNASHDLIVKPGSDLTADRILTITTGDAARTLTFTADATIGGTTSGTNTGDQTLGSLGAQAADATLTALAGYNTNGLLTQTAADTFAGRTLTATATQITVANGDGVSGNPALSFPADVLIPTVLTVPNVGLHLLDTNATHDLIVKPGSDLTADRTFTLTTGDSNRTLTMTGDTSLGGGTHSGTNTGDQTITLTGEVTGSGAGSFATAIAVNVVTNTELADVPTATFKGRTTALTGDPEDLTVAQAKTLLNLTGTNSGDQTITLTGPVTGSGTGSFATTIAVDAVGNTQLANVNSATFKGRITAAAGDPEDLTGTQATTLLDVFTSTLKGLVPSGSGGSTVNYLRADGTWQTPPGAGGQPADATLTALAAFNTNGLLTQTAADTFAGRTITATATQITVTNGDGVSGNPALSFPSDILVPTVLTVPNSGLHVLDTDASHDLIIKPGSNLTIDRIFTITTGDAARTLTLGGDVTLNSGTHSGTNTGDQTITLTTDVTGSGAGSFAATIAADAVTNTKLANVNSATFKGRITASAGDPEDLTGTQATTLLDVFTSTLKGLAPSSSGGTVNYLRADGQWQVPPNQTITLTSDVTGSGTGSFATTIANNAVTYAKMQDVSATARFIGRITAAAGDPEELTGTQATTLLDVFTSTLKGLVPSGSGGSTVNYLRGDGTWQAPPGSGAQPLDATLTALAALDTTAGVLAQTGTDTFAKRTITGTANQIAVANGTGASANPTLSLDATDIIVPAIITAPNSGLHILDTNASHDLIIKPGSDLTLDRIFTLTTGDAARTLTINADTTLGGGTHSGTNTGDQTLAGLGGAASARILTAGAGMTGGGDLTADRTFDVIGSTSIIVGANDVQRAALTGDVTAGQNVNATAIAVNVVDNTKLADMVASTFKGRVTASTGNPEDMTVAQAKTLLNLTGTNSGDQTLGGLGGQPLDADLTSWAAITRASGFDTFATTPSSANLAALLTDETGSGANVFATSPGFTTAANPISNDGATLGTGSLQWSDLYLAAGGVINFANGTAFFQHVSADNSLRTSVAIGYGPGSIGIGGSVTQLTSKATTVTLNTLCGSITMHNASLAANTTVSFSLNNSTLKAGDILILTAGDTAAAGRYLVTGYVWMDGVAQLWVRNLTSAAIAENIVIDFAMLRKVTT